MNTNSTQLIQDYYAAFNAGNMEAFVSLLADDVAHDINQGTRENGKQAFAAFMEHMNAHYKEQLEDIVVMTNEAGNRAAAEFIVVGEYLKTDEGLPEANGQTYRLPAGAFFEISENKITRISNYYNLGEWLDQVDP